MALTAGTFVSVLTSTLEIASRGDKMYPSDALEASSHRESQEVHTA